MRKGIIYAEFPAPYRVSVFEALAQKYEIQVFYETKNTEERSKDYAVKTASFPFEFLSEEEGMEQFKRVCRNLNKYDFVLVYNACLKNGVKLVLASKQQKVPYFVNNDGGFVRHNLIKDCIKKYLFSNASLCFAAGNVSREYFKAYGVKDDRIKLHNFTSLTEKDILSTTVSEQEKQAIRKELGLSAEKKIALTVGQFIKRKGFDILLKGWKERTGDRALLIIIGGGSKRSEYEQYIKDYSIQNVLLYDFFPKETLVKYYKAADVFVFPTREDIWGLVINEAMAAGLPIVSSDMCLAARELVEPSVNGFIYPLNDTVKMMESLNEVLDNDILRRKFSENNIKKMQGCTMEAIGLKHIKDIEDFLKNR